MSILVDDSNKTACRAAEAGLQQKNCAALVRPAGTGKGCIVWELLDAHPEMRVLWVVSCAARLELRRALTKRLDRTLGGRVRLMSCEQLAVQNALGWVALAEFRPGLLVLDGWREMSAKDWTDCVQPLFRLCPGAKLLALGEPDAPGDSCRAAEEMLADAIVEPLALGGAMAEGLLPMPASYTALLWPLEDAMARLRAEVKNLHLPGCPDPNAEKYQALSLAVEKLPPLEQLLAQWLPDAAGRCLVLCEDDAAAAQTAEQAEKLFGAGTHIYKDAEGFAADEAATLRLLVCANGPAVQAPLAGISGVVLVRRSAGPAAYRQMLARALAACGSVPVAELSAAFEALTCVQQLRKECSAAGAEAFPLEEPLSACRRAYRAAPPRAGLRLGALLCRRKADDGRGKDAGRASLLQLRGRGRGPLAGKPAPCPGRKEKGTPHRRAGRPAGQNRHELAKAARAGVGERLCFGPAVPRQPQRPAGAGPL